jgi:hypothetical protein
MFLPCAILAHDCRFDRPPSPVPEHVKQSQRGSWKKDVFEISLQLACALCLLLDITLHANKTQKYHSPEKIIHPKVEGMETCRKLSRSEKRSLKSAGQAELDKQKKFQYKTLKEALKANDTSSEKPKGPGPRQMSAKRVVLWRRMFDRLVDFKLAFGHMDVSPVDAEER